METSIQRYILVLMMSIVAVKKVSAVCLGCRATCDPACESDHFDCIRGKCVCNKMWSEHNCSWASGMEAIIEEEKFTKTFLFFDYPSTWFHGKEYCADIGGLLGMPLTVERHEYLHDGMLRGNMDKTSSSVWLGFSDVENEGVWKFENGDNVNLSPEFELSEFTDGGSIELHSENTTGINERWHFYYDQSDLYTDYEQAKAYCARLNAHLIEEVTPQEHERIKLRVKYLSNKFWIERPKPLFTHGLFYLGAFRELGNFTSWRYNLSGRHIYLNEKWYIKEGYPLPPRDKLKLFFGWKYPSEPNNNPPGALRDLQETCLTYHAKGWIDFTCFKRVHTFCEKGPYPFERWHLGGTLPSYAEPNDGEGGEDCGVMRIDFDDSFRFNVSDVLKEYWNDYDCYKKFSYVCEVDLPPNCDTYNPPLSLGCVNGIRTRTNCDGYVSDQYKQDYLSPYTITHTRNLMREYLRRSANVTTGLYKEVCDAPEFITFPNGVEMKFVTQKLNPSAAAQDCTSEDSVLAVIQTQEMADLIKKKLEGSKEVTGEVQFWIGLDDLVKEGEYEWGDGQILMDGDYTNWAPTYRRPKDALDCIALHTEKNTQWDQENCNLQLGYICIKDYPENCTSYVSGHSVDCLRDLFLEQCLQEGEAYPPSLSSSQIRPLETMHIKEYRRANRRSKAEALSGDKAEQRKCYGLEFPENCTTYEGPLSVECLTSIWLGVGCKHAGTGIPYKLSEQERLDEWKDFNLREATAAITEAPYGTASEGDVDEQTRCYGEGFPDGCTSFDGPFTVECLNSIWKNAGCLEEGTEYPSKLSSAEIDAFQTKNLDSIKEEFENLYDGAYGGDKPSQRECFGTEFPDSCDSYHPPLSRECLTELWLNKVGCKHEGSMFPGNVSLSTLDKTWGETNLNEAEAIIQEWKDKADAPPSGNPDDPPVGHFQKLCYGYEFPENCTYEGPFTDKCLTEIWESVGCTEQGYDFPTNLSSAERSRLDGMTLPEVTAAFNATRNAVANSSQAQLDCYGIEFPENCTTFEGPLSVECLTAIWLEVGCTHRGTGIPYKLSNFERLEEWKDWNITKVREEITKSPYETSLRGNRADEQRCKGVDLPENCTEFEGPYSMECLISIWKKAGCVEEGDEFPPKLNPTQLANINSMIILDVIEFMDNISERALDEDVDYQRKCYGLEFCPSCEVYHPVLSLTCLNEIWLDKANCTADGTGYPENLPDSNLTERWGPKNQRQAIDEMLDIRARADASDPEAQLLCFGFVLPPNCTFYPPQNEQCLIDEFLKVGCTTSGTHYPGKATSPFNETYRNSAGYADVFRDMKVQPDDQLGCYGLEFPDECNYKPPHSEECLCILFTDYAGCNGCGGGDEGQVPTARKDHYNQSTIKEVFDEFKEIQSKASNSKDGIDFETCNGSDFVPLDGGPFTVKVVLEGKPYDEASKYCRDRSSILLFSIPDAAKQKLLEDKLKRATDYFDSKTWWLGLDDIEIEGVFYWKSKVFQPSIPYSNFHSSLPATHPDRDCGVMRADQNFQWNVDYCTSNHFFICQEVNCDHTVTFPPLGEDPDRDEPYCSSVICDYHPNVECRAAACHCVILFSEDNCSEAKGQHAEVEVVKFNKSFLFFSEVAGWKRTQSFCADIGGYLAVPNTKERHDLIYDNILKAELEKVGFSVWLGFSIDGKTEWTFENGDRMNMAPDFGDLTGGGSISKHVSNTTSVSERWHFYYDDANLFLSRQEVIDYCANMGGHLPITEDEGEDTRMGKHMDRLYSKYRGILSNNDLPKRRFHYLAFLDLMRPKDKLDQWVDSNGVRYFNPRWWYKRHPAYPIPFPDELAKYQGWLRPDPDNGQDSFYQPDERELCGFQTAEAGWVDYSCDVFVHPVCERGPTPFERWTHGGTDPFVAEPNNGWCQERCGSMRLDLELEGKEDVSGVHNEFWNDLNCDLKLPFVCEIDLPTGCKTYEPPLSEECILEVAKIAGCPGGHMTKAKLEQFAQMTIIQVRNEVRTLRELAADRLNGVAYEACIENPDTFTDFPGEAYDFLAKTEEYNYTEARDYCRAKSSYLPKITIEVEDILRQKLKDADKTSGNVLFWIGLDDIESEGFFEWCSGEPLDEDAGQYVNWSPTFTVSEEDKDCVALDVTDDFRWVEVDCSSELGFVCIEPDMQNTMQNQFITFHSVANISSISLRTNTALPDRTYKGKIEVSTKFSSVRIGRSVGDCEYPLLYDRIHKDQCVHFRVDQKDPPNSIYKKTLENAEKNCEKSFGNILEIKDFSTAHLFDNFGLNATGIGVGVRTKFWVPLYDVVDSVRINATERNWQWKDGNAYTPLGDYNTFIIDSFMISNVFQNTSKKSKVPHLERCLYGDGVKHVYGEPFGPFEAHHYARSKSCDFNPPSELTWTWVSTYHLLHIPTGLCLTAPFQQLEIELEALSPGVRVRPCNLSDSLQQWTCHSRTPFHLKLRGYKYSILFDQVEPFDRAHMSGPLYGESCQTLWRTLANEYICDERYRPVENLFLTRKNGLRPTSVLNTVCTYPDRVSPTRFVNKREADSECYLQGGKPATIKQISQSLGRGFSEGCACAYTMNDEVLRGAMLFVDSSCQGASGLPQPTRGVFQCEGSTSDYVFCFRGDFSNPHYLHEVQYTPLCATYSFLSPELVGFQERSCLAPHYFACKKTLPDVCPEPVTPSNSHYVTEDWRKGRAGCLLRCDPGYGRSRNAARTTLQVTCATTTWSPNPNSINCQRLRCPAPPTFGTRTRTSDPPGISSGDFKFGDKVIYTCTAGFGIRGDRDNTVSISTCDENQQWHPSPGAAPCSAILCKRPPNVPNARAIYNASTQSLYYQCKKGFWISSGIHRTSSFTCNNTGYWEPDPLTSVKCVSLSCPDPPSPLNGTASISSFRYGAKLEIKCDAGFARAPHDLNIVCDEDGHWSMNPAEKWCKQITCPPPGTPGPRVLTNGTIKSLYQYGNELQHTCNEKGYELRKPFQIYNIVRGSCLGIDSGNRIFLEKFCFTEDIHVSWTWVGQGQLLSLQNEKCLQASGAAATRIASLVTCDPDDDKQIWACEEKEGFEYTLLLKGTNYVLRVLPDTNTVRVSSDVIDTLSTWKIGPGTENFAKVCSEQRGYPAINSICTRNGTWNPPHTLINCQLVRCPELTTIEFAKRVLHGPEPTYGTNATYTCEAGKWLKKGFVEIDLMCDATGSWVPNLEVTKCTPLLCPAPYDVAYSAFVGTSWSYQSEVTYTCNLGMWFSRSVYTKKVKCGVFARWEPDPETTLECIPVTCLDPGSRPHATYYITQTEVDYNAIVVYTCDYGYYFSESQGKTRGVTCKEDGSYAPDPATLNCVLATCDLPRQAVRNARFVNDRADRILTGSTITIQCLKNYWIRPGVFSGESMCDEYQNWVPEPSDYVCVLIVCEEPYIVPNATVSGKGLQASSTRTIFCDEGFFIEQQSQLKEAEITCDYREGVWKPRRVSCKEVECRSPGDVYNASLHIDSESRTFMERLVYRCDKGYALPNGSREFITICHEHGRFEPDVTGTTCFLQRCNFTSKFTNGRIVSNYTSHNSVYYWYDESVRLVCDDSYWIVLDKGYYSIDFVCNERGLFEPNPLYINCELVFCPTLPPMIHSVLSVFSLTAGSVATYRCSKGFGSLHGNPPQAEWKITCRKNATWDINPKSVICREVNCGPPEHVRYTYIEGRFYTYGNVITYKCIEGRWFERGLFEWNATCSERRLWEPPPPECVDVMCPELDPNQIEHATFIGDEFYFLSQISVVCDKGYFINPGSSQATLRCLSKGEWDLDQSNYTCRPIECPDLPIVWHATKSATGNKLGDVVTFTCVDDYLISRTSSETQVTCMDTARWHPDPAFIKCMEKTSFLCDKPDDIPNANMIVASYAYNSYINVSCLNGFWIKENVYFTSMRCLFNGRWEPSSRRIRCKRIECVRLGQKPNSHYIGSAYTYNGSPFLSCDNAYRISQKIDGKDVMTYMKSIPLICGADGEWHPSPNSVSCQPAGCPKLVPQNSLIPGQTADETSFGTEVDLSCPDGMYITQNEVSISVFCLETGLWFPDLDKITCHPIRCGISTSPSNGTFSGRSAAFEDEIKFQCYEGYHIPPSDEFALDNPIITEVNLVCLEDGTFEGIDDVIDCQRLTCNDPGYIVGASRLPLALKQRYDIGDKIVYTCVDESWFYRGKKSQTIVCADTAEWRFGDSSALTQCEKVTCWQPPHITHSIKPNYWATKFIYEVGELVYYNCEAGTRFNIPPPVGRSYYSTECQTDGMWSPLPYGLTCEARICDDLPIIAHSTYTRDSSMLPGSNTTYKCDPGYELQSQRETEPLNLDNSVHVRCLLTGNWWPSPSKYRCRVKKCPDPPPFIPAGKKYGSVYESGFHVNYVCDYGYTVAGLSSFFGKTFATIICETNGRWSLNTDRLMCQRAVCGEPQVPDNTTVVTSGLSFEAVATFTCIFGHFFDQFAEPDPIVSTMSNCTASGMWNPNPRTLYCVPFDCDKPAEVPFASLYSAGFYLGAVAQYHCDEGYVIDHGEDGLPSPEYTLAKSMRTKCQYPQSWVPRPTEDIHCVLIQCIPPNQPRRAYLSGGRWKSDGTHYYRFRDVATVTCAHGYSIRGTTSSFSRSAICTSNSTWTQDISNIVCVDIACEDPGYKRHAERSGKTFRYLSRLGFSCVDGYFIRPGILTITLQCSHDATWMPPLSFECVDVNCGDPGELKNGMKIEVSGEGRFRMNDKITYVCEEGFLVAQEEDAVGEWVVDELAETNVTTACQPNGRWLPRRYAIHCSKVAIPTTLYELAPPGRLLHPEAQTPLIPEEIRAPSLDPRLPSGRLHDIEIQVERAPEHVGVEHVSFHHTDLSIHCLENEVLVIHHLGEWINVEKNQVKTKHVPALLTDVGVECDVESMFDGEADTYWLPVEAPYPDEHFVSWPGWVVTIDLGSEFIIGSFRLHTSKNYVNDVKTFYIEASSNGVAWKILGPFHPIVESGGERKEFFYDFETLQSRFVRLTVSATVLMNAPIIHTFGIYAAPFDCVERIVYLSDSYAVPVYVGIVLLIVAELAYLAARADKRNRWKRFILKSPPKFDYNEKQPVRMYEVAVTTAWNTCNADVLLKVVGTRNMAPILWLRSSFKGTLRPGYMDTNVIQVPCFLGTPIRVDMMCAYTHNPHDVASTEHLSDAAMDAHSEQWKPSVTSQIVCRLRTLFSNESFLIRSSSQTGKTYRATNILRTKRLKFPSYEVAGIVVRDPGYGGKWIAAMPMQKKFSLYKNVKNFFFGKQGVVLEHGKPKSFVLTPIHDPRKASIPTPIYSSVQSYLQKLLSSIFCFYQNHLLAYHKTSLSRNFTCCERCLIAITVVFHTVFIASIIHGFENPEMYFITRLNSDSDVLEKLLQDLIQHPRMLTLATSFGVHIVVAFILRLSSGTWDRKVEDDISYWQGVRFIRANIYVVKNSFWSLFSYIRRKCCAYVPDNLHDDISFNSDDTSNLDLADSLTRTIQSTYTCATEADPEHKIICNPLLTPRSRAISGLTIKNENQVSFDQLGWFVNNEETVVPTDIRSILNEYASPAQSETLIHPTVLPYEISQDEFLRCPSVSRDNLHHLDTVITVRKGKNNANKISTTDDHPSETAPVCEGEVSVEEAWKSAELRMAESHIQLSSDEDGRCSSDCDDSHKSSTLPRTTVSNRTDSDADPGVAFFVSHESGTTLLGSESESVLQVKHRDVHLATGFHKKKRRRRKREREYQTLTDTDYPSTREENYLPSGRRTSTKRTEVENFFMNTRDAPPPSAAGRPLCYDVTCSKRRNKHDEHEGKIKDSLLHVITYRAYPPEELGVEVESSKTDVKKKTPKQKKYVPHPADFPPHVFLGVLIRTLVCLVCSIYSISIVVFVAMNGAYCIDGAGSELLQIYILDLCLLLFVLMPLAGWIVVILHAFVIKTRGLFAILARNLL